MSKTEPRDLYTPRVFYLLLDTICKGYNIQRIKGRIDRRKRSMNLEPLGQRYVTVWPHNTRTTKRIKITLFRYLIFIFWQNFCLLWFRSKHSYSFFSYHYNYFHLWEIYLDTYYRSVVLASKCRVILKISWLKLELLKGWK